MASTKHCPRLNEEEDHLLRILYKQFGVTTDNLPRVPETLESLTATFNSLTGRADSAADLLHYMMTRRKKKQWEKLGRGSQPKSESFLAKLSAADWLHIDAIYEELQIASDNFAFDEHLSKKFADEFARRSGRVVPSMILAAAVVTRRKAAKLATLKPRQTPGDLGFADIDEVAS
jgi:hypothetical protein